MTDRKCTCKEVVAVVVGWVDGEGGGERNM